MTAKIRSHIGRRPSGASASLDKFKPLLLATVVGFGFSLGLEARAEQSQTTAGVIDGFTATGALSSSASLSAPSIITLADASGPMQASASGVGATSPRVGRAASASEGQQPNLVLAQNATTAPAAAPAAGADQPYANFDAKLGTNPFVRFWNYQKLELGMSAAPVDPTQPAAPPTIRAGWPAVPQSTPPMPFTDWPYGGTTLIGDNRTGSIDSPLMVAIAHTPVGNWLSSTGIQAYGWIDYGGNISTSKLKYGNAPAAYDYNPDSVQLDQAVLYVERTPDTVQTDHIDWGFRFSVIGGENYRYTTSYGLASYQLLKDNHYYGYDFPMLYGEIWIPKVAEGLMVRVGRYISLPDIEAQLAPNNYMYTHSITYTLDNYTNEGIQTTLAVTKQIMLQVGFALGTEAAPGQVGAKLKNLFPNNAADLAIANAYLTSNGLPPVTSANPLYPSNSYYKDPGAQPSFTLCGRYVSLDGANDINVCADAINHGQYGYNNLQWYGFTAYHAFNKQWHISYEFYDEHEDGVPNINNPLVANVIIPNGGEPFSPQNIPVNAPYPAYCKSHTVYRCQSDSVGTVFYLNYSPNALNNISLRGEYYDDAEGQRTGVPAVYYETGIGWQHWLSPQIEMRPEVVWYHSSKLSFDLATKRQQTVFSGDLIWHF